MGIYHLPSTSSCANFFRACWSTLLFTDCLRLAQLKQVFCRSKHTLDIGRASMNETPPYSFIFEDSSRAIHCVNSSMVSIEFGLLATNPYGAGSSSPGLGSRYQHNIYFGM